MLDVAGYKISVGSFSCFHNHLIENCIIGVGDIVLNRGSIQKDTSLNQACQRNFDVPAVKLKFRAVQNIVVFVQNILMQQRNYTPRKSFLQNNTW